jgi:uridylate kinase
MDMTAISLLKDNKIPVRVVNIMTPGVLKRLLTGEDVGTLIT